MRRGHRKFIPVAAVPHPGGGTEYFAVDHVDTSEKEDFSGSHPYFIGLQAGFDIIRFVVYGRSEEDALETAEQRWPIFGEEHNPEISIFERARNFFPRAEKMPEDRVVFIKPTAAQVARDPRHLRLGLSFLIKLH